MPRHTAAANPAREQGILGKTLEIPSVQKVTVDIDSGTKQYVYIIGRHFEPFIVYSLSTSSSFQLAASAEIGRAHV